MNIVERYDGKPLETNLKTQLLKLQDYADRTLIELSIKKQVQESRTKRVCDIIVNIYAWVLLALIIINAKFANAENMLILKSIIGYLVSILIVMTIIGIINKIIYIDYDAIIRQSILNYGITLFDRDKYIIEDTKDMNTEMYNYYVVSNIEPIITGCGADLKMFNDIVQKLSKKHSS